VSDKLSQRADANRSLTILVTGASGLIGRHLVAALAEHHRVWAVSRRPQEWPSHVTGVQWDLSVPAHPSGLPDVVDAVIHLAQSDHFRDFPARADDIFAVNVAATARLLDWSHAAGVRRFICASSGNVERADGYYLISKRCAELVASGYSSLMTVLILRFFFVYGRGQRADMLIPRLVSAVRDQRPILLSSRDGLLINPVHVSDAVAAIQRALTLTESLTIDIAGPETLSLRDIGAIIGQHLDRAPIFQVDELRRPDEIVGDITAMRRWLCAPSVKFADGIDDVVSSAPDGLRGRCPTST
jgi:UDP-glucose 4-epimerase